MPNEPVRASSMAGARVLVADDDRSSIELLEMLLRQTGYVNVRTAGSAGELVALCTSWNPDALLVELGLPSATPRPVLEQLERFTAGEHGVPVIAMSASRDPGERRQAMALGARDFLTKPLDVAEVLVRLRTQLETRRLRQRLDALLPMAAREPEPGPDSAPSSDPDGPRDLLSLQEAADALGVSASTLRRWADGGRIRAVRTQGGHRRFDPASLRTLKARIGERRPPAVRPVAPPERPMPMVARLLENDGQAVLKATLRVLYRSEAPGWFAGPDAEPALSRWIGSVSDSARGGEYGTAIAATRSLEQHAAIGGASLLECHQFLGYFRAAMVRVLTRRGAERDEMAAAHRLMSCFEQRLLHEHDTRLSSHARTA
jgi:excisionase family DNA binding protein